ncbi:hypothetical protein V490_09076, partial [Pseudogymnoascus sp. VKM F-3557]
MQAYRVRQAILLEIDGHEGDCFALFPEYIQRIRASDSNNQVLLHTVAEEYPNSQQLYCQKFEAIAFAPASLIEASTHCRSFMALDATHTKSKFRMMLLIATTIDANDNLLPIAWALVPTENVEWWTWFLGFIKDHFLWANQSQMVFISDRDKGIAFAITTHFPNGNQAHCCQHIADNIQTKFGLTCRNQFWKVARAKDKTTFK